MECSDDVREGRLVRWKYQNRFCARAIFCSKEERRLCNAADAIASAGRGARLHCRRTALTREGRLPPLQVYLKPKQSPSKTSAHSLGSAWYQLCTRLEQPIDSRNGSTAHICLANLPAAAPFHNNIWQWYAAHSYNFPARIASISLASSLASLHTCTPAAHPSLTHIASSEYPARHSTTSLSRRLCAGQ